MPKELDIGDSIPPFSIQDSAGKIFTERELLGKMSLMYFYPKDNTPGCTLEACGFRDSMEEFATLNVQVIGVSPDSPTSHTKFAAKYKLPFTLLSDEKKELCQLFGVWKKKSFLGKKYHGVERSTFVIDPQGVIVWAERKVSLINHLARVKNILKEKSYASKSRR